MQYSNFSTSKYNDLYIYTPNTGYTNYIVSMDLFPIDENKEYINEENFFYIIFNIIIIYMYILSMSVYSCPIYIYDSYNEYIYNDCI